MDNKTLQSYIDRMVKLKMEQRQLAEFLSDVKLEAKSNGFDVGALDEVVARIVAKEELLKKRKEREEIARVYAEAIGQMSLF
jgi:uncharacterized protein (UPF0335 family)